MRRFTVDELERTLRMRKNATQAQALRRLVGTQLEFSGLNRDDFVQIMRELHPIIPDVSEEFIWLNFLQDLWSSSVFEARLMALQLMFAKSDLIDAHLWNMLEHWNNNVDNWVLADWLGHIKAVAIYKVPSLITSLAPWLMSDDRWRRRSALVSLVYIDPQTCKRRLLLEPHEIFAFIEPVLGEEDEAVQKALLWLLEEIDVHFPDEMRLFLKRYNQRLAPAVLEQLAPRASNQATIRRPADKMTTPILALK